MRILVADDEPIVLDSICQILRQESDLEVAVARTGREAIQKAEEFRPELVLMDIKMPGINGLEALTEIRRRDSSVILVILSAYENFSYAQEAIRLEVFDYLLKPISKSRLLETIVKTKQQFLTIKSARENELNFRERFKKLLPTIENEFIHALINGVDETTLKEYQELLGTTFNAGFFMAISYLDYSSTKYENELETEYLIRQRTAKLAEEIRCLFPCMVGPFKTNPILVFVPLQQNSGTKTGSGNETGINSATRIDSATGIASSHNPDDYLALKILDHFQGAGTKQKIRVGIGGIYKSSLELRRSYHEAIQSLNNQLDKTICHYRDLRKQPEFNRESELHRELQDLYESIRFGQVNKVQMLLNNLLPKYTSFEIKPEQLLFYLLEILITACRIAKEHSVNHEEISICYPQIIEIFSKGRDISNEDLIQNEVPRIIIWLTEIVKQGRETQIKTIIRQAKSIVEQRFTEHLSLEELSQAVNTSPFYLSRLFREELGVSFMEYLTKLRLEKAAVMLSQGLSVKECCFTVGYNDPNYFSRIFRKYYTMTPTEFRDKRFQSKGGEHSQ